MLDRDRLEELLDAMAESLAGDWLLVGGALVALWLEPRRLTEDVDIVGLGGTQGERLRLMEFAESQGLPIEAVNSAVDFFVQRIHGWRDEIEIFREQGQIRIFRPSPTLFLLLKVGRLSEQDLEDCLAGTPDRWVGGVLEAQGAETAFAVVDAVPVEVDDMVGTLGALRLPNSLLRAFTVGGVNRVSSAREPSSAKASSSGRAELAPRGWPGEASPPRRLHPCHSRRCGR
jgi:hypothetical protein